LTGTTQNLELSGGAKAELSRFLKEIADLGIEGAAKYQSWEWQGLLQQDLAEQLNNSRNCHIPSDFVVDQWVSNVESSSPRNVLLLHDLWTTFRHLLWSQITSAISMAWDFTTKSGGIWTFLLQSR
jgi:hypothetical protein